MFIKNHIIHNKTELNELIIPDINGLYLLIEHNDHKYDILSIYRSLNGNISNFLIYLNNVITTFRQFTSHVNNVTCLESNTCRYHVFTNINTNSPTFPQVSFIDSLITDHYPVIKQLIYFNSNTINNNIYIVCNPVSQIL